MTSIVRFSKKFAVIAILTSCIIGCNDDNPTINNAPIDPTQDPSKLSKALLIDGKNMSGTPPEANAPSSLQILYYQESASVTSDNALFIPFVFQEDSDIAGIYFYIEGADNYWDIPVDENGNIGGRMQAISSTLSDDNTLVLNVGIPGNIMEGSFNASYKIYDRKGRIGDSKTLSTSIVAPEEFCIGGQSFGVVEGEDGITVRSYNLGSQAGWISIQYNTYTLKDRIDVKFGSEWIRSTGGLIGNTAPPIKLCNEATEAEGFVGKTGQFHIFYDPKDSQRLDIYVSGCLDGGTQWIYETLECPKEKPTLGIHSNVGPDGELDDGHAWVSLTQNGVTTFYGLWPDGHARVIDNGADSDVRTNIEGGVGPYRRYYPLTEGELQKFQTFKNRSQTWNLTYNCSSWAEELVNYVIDPSVDAGEITPGVETPRKLSASIEKLESNAPTSTQFRPANVGEDKTSCSFCF